MSLSWTNEFKVGLFVLFAGVAGSVVTVWSIDGITPKDQTFTLHLAVPSADGLYRQSAVKLAGVDIGAIGNIAVAGEKAEIELKIRAGNELPVDSSAEIRSSGIIGDRYIAIGLGDDERLLKDGDRIQLTRPPPDLEEIEHQVQDITTDLREMTKQLRKYTDNDANREAIEATLQNVKALSEDLRMLAERNSKDIDAIVDSVGRLSKTLEGMATDTRGDVGEEMDKLKAATDSLQGTVDDMKSITGKIDGGEGTIGALVNDRTTVDLVNQTVGDADKVIRGFSGLRSEVYYNGRYYFGSTPKSDEFFYGNPLAGGGANIVGVRLMPQEDFWYSFEFVDYPQGTVTYTEHLIPDTGERYTEWERQPNYRMTFEINKRWHNLGLRLGVKEDGGGVGASYWLFDDKLELQGDVFDFDLGSYPAMSARGIPNARLLGRYSPNPHVYLEAGTEQPFLGIKYHYFTGFIGAGFSFNDDDIKLLLATLPLNF